MPCPSRQAAGSPWVLRSRLSTRERGVAAVTKARVPGRRTRGAESKLSPKRSRASVYPEPREPRGGKFGRTQRPLLGTSGGWGLPRAWLGLPPATTTAAPQTQRAVPSQASSHLFAIYSFIRLLEAGSHISQAGLRTPAAARDDDLDIRSSLPPPPQGWDGGPAPPCPAWFLF